MTTLSEMSAPRQLATWIAVESYDLFLRGRFQDAMPALSELTRLADQADDAGKPELKDAMEAWLESLCWDGVILRQHESELSDLGEDSARIKARRILEDAKKCPRILEAVKARADFRIVGPDGKEDTTGTVGHRFDYSVTSETHFRSDRGVVLSAFGSKVALHAVCVPCLGQTRCPSECPAKPGRCGEDFGRISVGDRAQVLNYLLNGMPQGSRGLDASHAMGETREQAMKELVRMLERTGKVPTTTDIKNAGKGKFSGSTARKIRRQLEEQASRK